MDDKLKQQLQIKENKQPQMTSTIELLDEINAYAIDYYKEIEGPSMNNTMDNRGLLTLGNK